MASDKTVRAIFRIDRRYGPFPDMESLHRFIEHFPINDKHRKQCAGKA